LNHVVNSFIYFYNDRRFRKELKAIYSCQKWKYMEIWGQRPSLLNQGWKMLSH
jgi:hypothetical protein